MIENDSRQQHHGIKIGDVVDFRWNQVWYIGKIKRLANSKAVVAFVNAHQTPKYVSYRQIRQSDNYTPLSPED